MTETEEQQTVVRHLLPYDGNATDAQLTEMGFLVAPGPPVDRYRTVHLPDGWEALYSDKHWYHLVDGAGRTRAVVFGGARRSSGASGRITRDTGPFLHFVRRFTVQVLRTYRESTSWMGRDEDRSAVVLMDAGRLVRCFGVVTHPPCPSPSDAVDGRPAYRAAEKRVADIHEQAYAWLRDHYPGYGSWQAHWDDPAVEPDDSIDLIPAGAE